MTVTMQQLGPDLCLSGGADGADLQWGMVAGTAGHSVVHWTFAGHDRRSQAPQGELVVLPQTMLDAADPACLRANETLGRKFPFNNRFVANLLRRNWYQVRDAASVYAISTIKRGLVQGGTAWAVQMFIDRFDGAACPAYVFCQEQGYWFTWAGAAGWERIYSPPPPRGVWAGIGTRKLELNGKLAIRVLLDYRKPAQVAA